MLIRVVFFLEMERYFNPMIQLMISCFSLSQHPYLQGYLRDALSHIALAKTLSPEQAEESVFGNKGSRKKLRALYPDSPPH